MKVNAGNLKRGEFVLHNGEIHQLQKTEFYSPGKGSALLKTKIKSIKTGKTVDFTYKSSEMVDTLDVESKEMQYLYKDNENLYFMNPDTFDQIPLPLSVVDYSHNYLKEGQSVYVYVYNDQALNLKPPASVRLKIIETEAAVKGDTVSGAKKSATLETGVTVLVPLFIKEGEEIVVNPETGQYVERSN